MIHPDTELRKVNDEIGVGVFATRFIPKGTLVYVMDPLEMYFSPHQLQALPEPYRKIVEKYSVIEPDGSYMLSWDIAKYVNHRCDCNTMSSGWGFEIALRDIEAGEEMTDEYGLFNLNHEMRVSCQCPNCRGVVRPDDVDRYYQEWDARIQDALAHLLHVEQPLRPFMDENVYQEVVRYLNGQGPYKSVLALKRQHAVPLLTAQPAAATRHR